jgi:hypothetical protein
MSKIFTRRPKYIVDLFDNCELSVRVGCLMSATLTSLAVFQAKACERGL